VKYVASVRPELLATRAERNFCNPTLEVER
jgi:hypothetical protein